MTYAKAFFDLQLEFALRVSALSGLPLARTVLEYTNFFIRFGLGRGFDPAHPIWQEYLAGLPEAGDADEWTYRFYLTRSQGTGAPPVVATFGCFSYALSSGDAYTATVGPFQSLISTADAVPVPVIVQATDGAGNASATSGTLSIRCTT